jgi:hypothetical protein
MHVFVTNFVKHIAVSLVLTAKLTKVDTKLMELVLKCTKSELNQAICKLAIKAGNSELKISMQYLCRAKLG